MQELGVGRVIISKWAPVYAPFGMLCVDLKHDYMRFYYAQRKSLSLDDLGKLYKEMEAEGGETLRREGIPGEEQSLLRFMDLRYYGQFNEIEVPWPNGQITEDIIANGIANFHAKHRDIYGYANEEYPIELMSFKLSAIGKMPRIELEEIKRDGINPSQALKGERDAFFEENNGLVRTHIYDGDRLLCENILEGPCIVEEKATTIVVPPRFRMTVDRYGNYVSME
jgi:N-methylhydantoinase A